MNCLKRYILRQLTKTRYIYKYHIHKVNVRYRNKIELTLDSHFYCLELVLYCMFLTRQLSIIVQYFILLVGQKKLSDTDAACVAIALAVCLERKKRIAAGPLNGTELNRPEPCNRRLTTY